MTCYSFFIKNPFLSLISSFIILWTWQYVVIPLIIFVTWSYVYNCWCYIWRWIILIINSSLVVPHNLIHKYKHLTEEICVSRAHFLKKKKGQKKPVSSTYTGKFQRENCVINYIHLGARLKVSYIYDLRQHLPLFTSLLKARP